MQYSENNTEQDCVDWTERLKKHLRLLCPAQAATFNSSFSASDYDQTLIVSLVLSRLDYGNAVLAGLPACLVRRLQSIDCPQSRTRLKSWSGPQVDGVDRRPFPPQSVTRLRYCSTHASPIPFPPLCFPSPFNAAERSAEAP